MLFGGLNHKLAKSSCCVSLAKCDRHIQTAPAVQQQHINAFFSQRLCQNQFLVLWDWITSTFTQTAFIRLQITRTSLCFHRQCSSSGGGARDVRRNVLYSQKIYKSLFIIFTFLQTGILPFHNSLMSGIIHVIPLTFSSCVGTLLTWGTIKIMLSQRRATKKQIHKQILPRWEHLKTQSGARLLLALLSNTFK